MNTDPLRMAHAELRKAVGPKRRAAHKDEGKLAAAFREAMAMWDALKAKGGTMADLVKGLEATLRESWPRGECACPRCRWACRDCEDTGARWGKVPARLYGGRLVDVVTPCHCGMGARFLPKQKFDEDFRSAGKSKMTKVGR